MEDFVVRRYPERAIYDKDKLYEFLDRNILCHVSFCENGDPFIIPMIFSRIGDFIYFHGSYESRLIRFIGSGGKVTIGITNINGLVVATHIKNNSLNYESAVVNGSGEWVEDEYEKLRFFESLSKKFIPGIWEYSKRPDKDDFEKTAVVRVKIEKFSMKVREGDPNEKEKYDNLWSGVIEIKYNYVYNGEINELPDFLKSFIKLEKS